METAKNNFYVYGHFTPIGEVFYIGKGKGKRIYSKDRRNPHWKSKVKKHGGYNTAIFQDNLDEKLAFEVEKSFIESIGRENLVNMTDGGEGKSGCIPSEESRKKMSFSRKGKPLSEDHRNNLSNSKRGDKHHNYGKFGNDNPKAKKVNQYSKSGEFIKTWGSIIDINRELGIHHQSISACCKGKYKTAGGFIFKYYGQS